MYTQCPACHSYFRITPEQLQAAGGKVRCGECRQVFHAPDFLTDALPGITVDGPLPDEPDYEQLLRDPAAKAPSAEATPALSSLSTRLATEDETPPRRLLATLAWSLGSLLLIAILAAQYVYLNRLTFAQHAELRPLLEQLCNYTGCRLPPRRDLAALTLLERDIRSHDRYKGALTISATLQNRAAFAQPYPAVDVVMRDLAGKVVAARRFQPQEYLSGTVPELLAPQATVQFTLDVLDPGAEAVGFEFTFH